MPENEAPRPQEGPTPSPPPPVETPSNPEADETRAAEAAERQAQEEAEHPAGERKAEEDLDHAEDGTPPTPTESEGPAGTPDPPQENREGQQTEPPKDEFKISMLWKEPSKFFDHVMVKGAVWFRQAAKWLRESGSNFWASVLEWVSNTDVAILFSKLQESAYELGDTMGDPEKRKPYINQLKQIYGKVAHLPQYVGGKMNKDTFYALVVNGLDGTQQTWDNIVKSAQELLNKEEEKAKEAEKKVEEDSSTSDEKKSDTAEGTSSDSSK